jgi:hypothetical protein
MMMGGLEMGRRHERVSLNIRCFDLINMKTVNNPEERSSWLIERKSEYHVQISIPHVKLETV